MADPALDDVHAISGLAVVGDVVLAGVGEAAVTVIRSPDRGATWAPVGAPAITEPKAVELVTLDEGQSPETGVRYHAPMYLHCGMSWFWFGDGPDVETGAGDDAPEGWPMAVQVLYGYAVLTDTDSLEYSVEDELIATYRRDEGAPAATEGS